MEERLVWRVLDVLNSSSYLTAHPESQQQLEGQILSDLQECRRRYWSMILDQSTTK